MKKLLLLIICSFILVSCDSSSKVEAIESSTLETENFKNSSQGSDVFEHIPPVVGVVEYAHYPEDFLTMRALVDSDDTEPFIYESGEGAHGEWRVALYKNYDTFEININSEWVATQIVYKNNNYITSEGIFVGSGKMDVMNAYEKYGIKEYDLSMLAQLNVRSLVMDIMGIDLAGTFLYVDNDNIFEETYTGIDYWGGLGAYIFILDHSDSVVKIVSCAPTSG